MDLKTDIPAVLRGVTVCGSIRTVRLGDSRCSKKLCDDIIIRSTGRSIDNNRSERITKGTGVLNGSLVVVTPEMVSPAVI